MQGPVISIYIYSCVYVTDRNSESIHAGFYFTFLALAMADQESKVAWDWVLPWEKGLSLLKVG